MTRQERVWLRWLPAPILLAVVGLLLIALWTGLARLGVPGVQSGQMTIHGPLMVSAVLGTLISLERAVALISVWQSRGKWLAFLAPLSGAVGGVLLVAGGFDDPARMIILLSSLGLVGIFTVMMRRHPTTDAGIMMVGAVALLIGNGLWLMGRPVFQVVHWWVAFLILTIVGERLELSRIRQITQHQRRYLAVIVVAYLVSIVLTLADLGWGTRLEGAAYLVMACWLFRYDVARVTIRRRDLPQFVAACLLSGYLWLSVGGVIALWQGVLYAGLYYEAFLHALLVGFVFSMIFGHAPIIIPALTGYSVRFSRLLYVPLALLHGSLVLRIVSNVTAWMLGRQWGGALNVISILVFLALMLFLMMSGRVLTDTREKLGEKRGKLATSEESAG